MALTKVSTPAIKDEAITLAKLLHGDSNSNGKFLRANNGADPTFETIDLTALSASNLTSGTIPDARFPATLPAASAANLTSIPAGNLTGTVADARISALTASKLTGALPAIDGSNLTGINTDLVSDSSPQLGGDLDSNGHHIVITDGEELRLGDDHDTKIRFNGSKSQIVSSVQFDIDADIVDIHNAAANITKARFLNNQIELYYANAKKFETQSGGTLTTGNVTSNLASGNAGQGQLNLGSSGAPFVRGFDTGNHGSGSKVEIISGDGDDHIICKRNAAVEIFHDASKKFETTSYGTKITGYQAATSYVGFHVKVTGNNNGFGQNHGSGITTYDTNYYSPIPMFNSRTVGFGNSYLQFPSYASGEYIKFTAPVDGLYHFSLSCSWETHHGGDWLVVGWERNMTSNSNNGVFQNNGVGVSGVFERSSVDSGGPSTLTTVIWLAANDTAVLYQQSTQAVRWKSNEAFVRGYLI